MELKERLGGGKFGDVYRGIWHGTTETALKKLKNSRDSAKFEREAKLLQSLRHPNIVQLVYYSQVVT
jgi:serine/threonine protein kinase